MTQNPVTGSTTFLLAGRYRVEEQLGAGRLATVQRAFDERLRRNVLLHMLLPELVDQEQLRQRFLTEIEANAQCPHPTLLEVFDRGELNRRTYMITDYVAGKPLYGQGALSLEEALLYVRQIARAIAARQKAGLPYPPVSSQNILVSEGQAKFVESWLLTPEDASRDLAFYRAPERTEGQAPTLANIVYALGLLLYELLTGTRPLSGSDAQTSGHPRLQLPPISQHRALLHLPSLEKLIARATARRPEERYANLPAFCDALDALWRELGTETQRLTPLALPQPKANNTPLPMPTPLPPPVASTSWVKKLRLDRFATWAIGILFLFLLVGGGYLLLSSLAPETLENPVSGSEVLVVNVFRLNLREGPGLSHKVLVEMPSGTRVHKKEGPRYADNVAWVRVQAEMTGNPEGWTSLNLLKPEQ